MRKLFLSALPVFLLILSIPLHAQNLQSVIKEVKAVVENNVNKVYITGDWGDGAFERISLEYEAGTNNSYMLKVNNALVNQSSLSFNSVVSGNNGFVFSTEQSDLLTDLTLIDSVAEEGGRVVYKVQVNIVANQPIVAAIASFDKTTLEVLIKQRYIPGESLNTSENTLSNTTTNVSSGGQLTFNPDGTPYIVPDEIGSVPRKGLTDDNAERQPVPVTSALEKSEFNNPREAASVQPGAEGQNPAAGAAGAVNNADQNGNASAEEPAAGRESPLVGVVSGESPSTGQSGSLLSGLPDDDFNKVYIDESATGGKILYENPALMNVMIVSSEKRKADAVKLSVILNKDKRVLIQNRLGMSFRVVNVAVVKKVLPKRTTVFYRKKYLKPAIVLSDEIDGNQNIQRMLNPEKKIGVDVEIILGE